jgi:hypothetical protein
MKMIIALFLMMVPWTSFADCHELDTPLTAYHYETINNLVDDLALLNKIDDAILSGHRAPTWGSFNMLENIVEGINARLKHFPAYKDILIGKAVSDARFQNILHRLETHNTPIEGSKYGPTGYGLGSSFRRKLLQLPAAVSSPIFARLAPMPDDKSKLRLLQRAREIVKRQVEIFKAVYATTGFAEPEQLRQALGENKTLKEFDQHRPVIGMRRPLRGRFWIEKVGFHNQHVTGSSEGLNNPERRNLVENFRLNEVLGDYQTWPSDLKPNYGQLLSSFEFFKLWSQSGTSYGDDFYIFDEEKVADRITWTLGDSLNRTSQLDIKDNTPKFWNEFFIPFRFKELIAAFLPDVTETIRPQSAATLPLTYNKELGDRGYIELQFFGPLTLDDVKGFVFQRGNPPTGDFLETLRRKNIKIYEDDDGVLTPY